MEGKQQQEENAKCPYIVPHHILQGIHATIFFSKLTKDLYSHACIVRLVWSEEELNSERCCLGKAGLYRPACSDRS